MNDVKILLTVDYSLYFNERIHTMLMGDEGGL